MPKADILENSAFGSAKPEEPAAPTLASTGVQVALHAGNPRRSSAQHDAV
jgi:hypothetical protein